MKKTGHESQTNGAAEPAAETSASARETLDTARLTLSRLTASDAPHIARLIADEEITRWLTSVPWPYHLSHAETFVAGVSARQSDHFGIRLQGALAGVVAIDNQLGYWLGRAHHGQGLMTEAAQAMVDRHFVCGHKRLASAYVVGNARSARVLDKLGFRRNGVSERYVPTLGRAVGLETVTLDRKTWEARQ